MAQDAEVWFAFLTDHTDQHQCPLHSPAATSPHLGCFEEALEPLGPNLEPDRVNFLEPLREGAFEAAAPQSAQKLCYQLTKATHRGEFSMILYILNTSKYVVYLQCVYFPIKNWDDSIQYMLLLFP